MMSMLFPAGVLAAFSALIFLILRAGLRAQHNFEKFICLGTSIMFTTQLFLNVGSAMGISPVVGVTFPFLSYDGSSILADALLLAIVYAIARESRQHATVPAFA